MAPLAADRPADGPLHRAQPAAVLLISNIMLQARLHNALAPESSPTECPQMLELERSNNS